MSTMQSDVSSGPAAQGRPVDLATVERALIADDSAMLRDLYPNLYAEAA